MMNSFELPPVVGSQPVESESHNASIEVQVRAVIGGALAGSDCDVDELVRSWAQSQLEGVPAERNRDAAADIERLSPGSVSLLQRHYGIQHFERYPINLLERMAQAETASENGEWGIMIYAREDHNGAMSQQAPLQELYETVNASHTVRVVECGSMEEARNALHRLSGKFGRAAFAIVCGHGTRDHIALGNEETEGAALTRENVPAEFGSALNDSLQENAEICLVSCSTGSEGGIGEELSDASGRETTAPTEDTTLISYGARVTGSHVHFSPVYGQADARRVRPGGGMSSMTSEQFEVGQASST